MSKSNASRSLRRTLPIAAALLGAVGAATLGAGCTFNRVEGNMRSDDHFTYVSTIHMPISVTLVDLRDGAEIWSYDVPVGRKLSLRFHRNAAAGEQLITPDLMKWNEFDKDDWTGELSNAIPVPPASARRLDVRLRQSQENPQGFEPAPTAVAR